MEQQRLPDRRRRNRNFDETHALLIEKAVELISAMGTEALSISALARESGINRSTVYYHFDSREALIEAVQAWSADQIAYGFLTEGELPQKVDTGLRFIMGNPEVMKLWLENFLSTGEIRDRYPLWDRMMADLTAGVAGQFPAADVDFEALCVTLLAGLLISLRVYAKSVRPGLPPEEMLQRLKRTHSWLLALFGIH